MMKQATGSDVEFKVEAIIDHKVKPDVTLIYTIFLIMICNKYVSGKKHHKKGGKNK